METLIVKNKTNTKALTQTMFKSEEEFETLVFDTPELLSDVFLIKRQVRGGNKTGIPDIIGIDDDGNICIIEMKNVTVDSRIIPQVLEYALWAGNYPDSIKSLWLECKNKPDDLEIDWNDTAIRIIVIAPKILNSTLEFINKINYVVDLFEVKQYVDNNTQYLFVNKLEAEKRKIGEGKPAVGQEIYGEEYYKKHRNPNSVPDFMRYTEELEKIIKDKNWDLEAKYNKNYCAFKRGFFIVFMVHWEGTKSIAFRLKVSKEESKKFGIPVSRFSPKGNAIYVIDPNKTKTSDFIEIFEYVYKKVLG